jgi:hypothetical protein
LSDQVWITDQRLRLLDTTFRILSQSQTVAKEVDRLFSGFERSRQTSRASNIVQITGQGDTFRAYRDCGRLASDADLPTLMSALVANLNFAAVEQCERLAVHAGVVGWPEGRLAIPASSGRGKTTLTAALLRSGFTFLSDEALVFDDDKAVVPYPKPLALSEWSTNELGLTRTPHAENLVMPVDLGSSLGSGGTLTDLVISEYGHGEQNLQSMPRSQAVATLIQYSFNHYKNPERAFRVAADVARDLRVWRLEYNDPLEAAELLSETLR